MRIAPPRQIFTRRKTHPPASCSRIHCRPSSAPNFPSPPETPTPRMLGGETPWRIRLRTLQPAQRAMAPRKIGSRFPPIRLPCPRPMHHPREIFPRDLLFRPMDCTPASPTVRKMERTTAQAATEKEDWEVWAQKDLQESVSVEVEFLHPRLVREREAGWEAIRAALLPAGLAAFPAMRHCTSCPGAWAHRIPLYPPPA